MSDRPPPTRALSYESRLLHGDSPRESEVSGPVLPPLQLSTNYRFPSVEAGAEAFRAFARRTRTGRASREDLPVYDRWSEPGRDLLEERLAAACSGDVALTFATGMAAVSAVASVALRPGDAVVLQRPLYGGTEEFYTRHMAGRVGARIRVAESLEPGAFAEAVSRDGRPAALVHLETPANPDVSVVDVQAVGRAVREAAPDSPPLLVVDNTFASPWCQRPLEWGADVVVESLTKFVSGFGAVMGGLVAVRRERSELAGALLRYRADAGGPLSPWAAWQILVFGLPTLPLRVARQQETALSLARALADRQDLRVSHPGLPSHADHEVALRQMRDPHGEFAPGAMLYLEFPGKEGGARARAFLDHASRHARTLALAASLGQLRTLVEAPALMSHSEAAGATPTAVGGVRVSVGIEPLEDLLADFEAALDACG